MTRPGALGLLVFGLVSLGLHAAAFGLFAQSGSLEAAGEGGDAVLSLVASDAALEALVAEWEIAETPEEIAPPDLAPPPPPPPSELPELAPLAELSRPMLALPIPEEEAAPETPSPSPEPEPKPEPKPEPPKKQAKKPSKAATATPAQRAQGAGGGSARGNRQAGQSATASSGQIRSAIAEWGASIRGRIERNKRAPELAPGQGGSVTLRLQVSRGGALQGVSVAKSSGNSHVDRAALAAVRRAGAFPAAPSLLTDASYRFNLRITVGN